MPLEQSDSDEAKSADIATEEDAGKPSKQAEAVAYAVSRDSARDRADARPSED